MSFLQRADIHLVRPLRLDRAAALALLRDLSRDRSVMADLRRLLARELGRSALHTLRDDQVLAQLAERVAAGALTVAQLRPPLPGAPPELAQTGGEAPEPPPPAPQETTFFQIYVIRDDTGEPVASVPLMITLPSGEEAEHTTDADGKIRVEDIEPGACAVRCELEGAARADTLIFLGLTGGPPPAPPPEDEGGDSGGGAGGGGSFRIAEMIKHKVATGETLAGLAESVGMSEQDLAKFNWDTDDPEKIKRFLRHDVGCTKKDADGNYVFDDSDEPGIVLLPAPWIAEGLAAGQEHVIRVAPAAQARPWVFSL